MATLTLYQSYEMTSPAIWFGTVVSYSTTQIKLTDGHHTGIVYGNFTYSGTTLSSGTVTSYEQSLDGTPEFKLADGNYSALTMLNFLQTGDFIGLYQFVMAGDDTVIGSAGNDTLLGLKGNDKLTGGLGDDTLDGGSGSDWALYDTTIGGGVTVNLSIATAQDTVNAGVDTLVNIENLLGSSYDDTLTGNAAANTLQGGSGNDRLSGGLGDDVLDGGAGIDWALYDTAAAGVTVSLAVAGAQNTVNAGNDTLISIENLGGSGFADILIGNDLANTLKGGAGNDKLTGGIGNDVLNGGAGSDWANYDTASAGVQVNLSIAAAQNTQNAGLDTLISIENLLGSHFDDTLTGNDGANTLQGSDGDDKLDGGLGNDVLDGGAGIDWATYNSADAGVTVSLAIAGAQNTGGAGSDTLISIENLLGSHANDKLTGNDGANTLQGDDGDDKLAGGLGDDVLDGGAGSDWALYDSAAAGVTVSLAIAGAQNTVNAGLDTLVSIENLLGGNFNDTLAGNTGANVLNGGAGRDKLTGGLGNDVLDGGAGSDWAQYDTATGGVKVNLSIAAPQNTQNAGTDTLLNIENLLGSGFDDTLGGNAANNTLKGGNGSDKLTGGLGNDVLDGGAGSDWAIYDTAAAGVTVNLAITSAQNTVSAGKDKLVSIENLTGSNFADTLTGNAAANTLNGGDGDDILDGGAGKDTLIGGAGKDSFLFTTALGAGNIDTITSFSSADDTIQLENSIFTSLTATGTLSADFFRAGTAALDDNDFIVYNQATGELFYDQDGNGVAPQQQIAIIANQPKLFFDDFTVI